MRKATRAILLAFFAFLSAVFVGVAAVMTSAITLAATALIVPGTGTHNIVPPNAVTGYMENAANRFIDPAATTAPFQCTSTNGCVLTGIPYPASFWPIPIPGWCPGLSCDTWNVSVATGVTNLNSQLINELMNPTPDNQQLILFGYSQGGQVVTNEMYNLAGLDDATKARIQVVTIGNIGNPQGLWSRFNFLPGLTVPILNVTFGPQLPTDIGIKSTNFAFEYDPVGDAPLNWWNGLTVLNALAAFEYVHGYYLAPNSNDPAASLPYGYTDATLAQTIDGLLSNCTEGPGSNCRTYQDATFVLIPWQGTLPLLQPVMDLADSVGITPIVKPIVDLIQPALKVLIDLGYDRVANPGIPRTMNLLPIFNPIKLAVDLVAAVGQGIQAFINDITGNTPAPAAPLTPSGPVSTFASVNAAGDDDTAKLAQADQIDTTDQSKLDALAAKKRVSLDDSTQTSQVKTDPKLDTKVEPLKVDPKPAAKVDPKRDAKVDPEPDTDGALNPAFTISPQNTSNGSVSTSTTKPNDGNSADVIELKPTQVEAGSGSTTTTTGTTTTTTTGTNVTTGQGTGVQQQQQQGTPTSSGTGQQQAAA